MDEINATNTINVNKILNDKMEGYNCNLNDFVAPSELTVTITLSEYRELLSAKATKDNKIDEIRMKNFDLTAERDRLQQENSDLKAKLYESLEAGLCKNPEEKEEEEC